MLLRLIAGMATMGDLEPPSSSSVHTTDTAAK
jgi:hypothetical protein